ncbi:MAG: bifunctional hydroxymethylpyrimidine kinase/phosphomethylpyrimidine kinase [Telluria sp.]
MQNQSSPLVLTFGVSDPVGALGIQADLSTIAAHGCHALTVATAILVADSARVEDLQEIDPDWVMDQARVLLEDMPVAAFKIGALASIEQASAIAEIVSDYTDVPLVLDPFLSSLPDSGLLDEDMVAAIRQILVPQSTLLMVSQVELARMAEAWREGGGSEPVEETVSDLIASGCEYVLVTGTSGANGARSNTLFGSDGVVAQADWQHLPGPFIGAGTTLSAALTALMARGFSAEEAMRRAQEYTTGALLHAQRFGMGKLVPNKFYRAGFGSAAQDNTQPTDHDN